MLEQITCQRGKCYIPIVEVLKTHTHTAVLLCIVLNSVNADITRNIVMFSFPAQIFQFVDNR
jgi:hypothetical protein